MTSIDLFKRQRSIEERYGKHQIYKHVRKELNNNSVLVDSLDQWIKESERSKTEITSVFSQIYLLEGELLITAVAGQLVKFIDEQYYEEQIAVAASLLVEMAERDLLDMRKQNTRWYIFPRYKASKQLRNHIRQTRFLPPMLVKPDLIENNRDSGYLTLKRSVLLGNGNHHNGEICLDSINKFNSVALSLNKEMLNLFIEKPPREPKKPEAKQAFDKFIEDSYEIYDEIIKAGNQFWLVHGYDFRGRTYARGYHVNTQSYSFKKAFIELDKKELIKG